jgi:hypothetical protein
MLPIFVVNCFGGVHVAHLYNFVICFGGVRNMHTIKTINYKDGLHVHHQINSLQRWETCTPPTQLTA